MILEYFPQYKQSKDTLIEAVNIGMNIIKLSDKMQILPLTLNLSQVACCLWEMSLRQSRAERNAVLLAHEFYNCGYIIPDHR